MSLIKRRVAENNNSVEPLDFNNKNNVIQPIYDFAPSNPNVKTRLAAGILALKMIATPVTTAIGLKIAEKANSVRTEEVVVETTANHNER